VSRRLDLKFRAGFDEWLQKSIATSQRQLGEGWMPAYLNAPIWRFVLGPDLCGEAPAIGVLMPSVDRVGRYFPLVLAAQLPGCLSPGSLFHEAKDWFEAAETLILTSLDDPFDLDRFDEETQSMGLPPYERADGGDTTSRPLRLDLDENGDLSATYARILDQVVMGGTVRFSLWWTLGSDKVDASVLLGSGLPPPTNFAAFLDGHWNQWGWELPRGRDLVKLDEFPLMLLKPVPELPSGGRTHPGTKRKVNEDSMLLRPDLGLWAVADGVGGHEGGEFASHTVTQRLAEILPPLSFGGVVRDLHEVLDQANLDLHRHAATIADTATVASTVVAMLVHGTQYVVIWSGDSRAYVHRGGYLQRLTRDHVTSDGMVTHAVGAEQFVFLETTQGEIQEGDVFLLCSDGLTKCLPESAIAASLTQAPDKAAEVLIQESLIAGARDNVTVVVVSVPPGRP
jgi:type VI secretion system protein ImpM